MCTMVNHEDWAKSLQDVKTQLIWVTTWFNWWTWQEVPYTRIVECFGYHLVWSTCTINCCQNLNVL